MVPRSSHWMLKLPYFEGLAAGYPSPAGDYQHESLDLNDKFVLQGKVTSIHRDTRKY